MPRGLGPLNPTWLQHFKSTSACCRASTSHSSLLSSRFAAAPLRCCLGADSHSTQKIQIKITYPFYSLSVCHGKRTVLNKTVNPQLLHQGLDCNSYVFFLHGWNSFNIILRHIPPGRFGVEGPMQGGGTCRTWQGY